MKALLRFGLACGLSLLADPALAQDADGDGVLDSADARPCDSAVAAEAYAPAADDHALLMFEDQFPQQGDLDFNDVVLSYRYRLELAPGGDAVRLIADLDARALGGELDHGLGLHLPLPRDAVTSATLHVEDAPPTPLAASMADAEFTVDVTADLRQLVFPGAMGPVNVSGPARAGRAFRVEVRFAPGTSLSASGAPYDLFVFRTADRPHEIHRTAYPGTARFRAGLFGTADDGSTPSRWFVDATGLPFAMHLPTLVDYPSEQTPISALYPRVVGFAASAGTADTDFYASGDVTAAYPTPTPVRALPPDNVDTSCVVPGREPNNPGTMCVDLLAGGATTDGVYWIDPDGPGGRDPFEAYCDMTTAGGGWTAIIAPQDRSTSYLRRFDLAQDTLSGWTVDSSYGVSWGAHVAHSQWRDGVFQFEARVPYDEARITHSGWYASPSGGLGALMIRSDTGQRILSSNDGHTDNSRGQSLYVGNSTIHRLARVNWTNRTDQVSAPGSRSLRAWMNAYTSSYPYTRRYISALWVR